MHPLLPERFTSKIHPEPMSGCWLWAGAVGSVGYGVYTIGRKNFSTHRFAWTIIRGPIPDGTLVCHKCDVRVCVNPEHMFLGSYRDNTLDKYRKGRGAIGEAHHSRRSTTLHRGVAHHEARLDPEKIRLIRADSRRYADIARDFGVSTVTIGMVRNRRTWKHVV